MSIKAYYFSLFFSCMATNLCFSEAGFSAPQDPTVPSDEVQRFADTLTLIKNYYVGQVKDHELFNQAISGILTGLDPQSIMIEKSIIERSPTEDNKAPQAANLGLELTIDEGILTIITPKLGSPAFKAGILPGDYLVKLGKHATQGLSLDEAKALLEGKEGSTLELLVLRRGLPKPLAFKVAFAKPNESSIDSKLLDKHLGYVRISEFKKNTDQEMKQAIQALAAEAQGGLKGLILDLRYNPGGSLESAVHVADAFIDNSHKNPNMIIVKTKGRIPNLQYRALATPGDVLQKAPMIVLINKGSAFGAEIVAGALKDNQRAITLGLPTAGKGSVQTRIPLDETTVLKITTALYVTPKGNLIEDKGIAPDMLVDALVIPKKSNAMKAQYSEADLKDHLVSGSEEKVQENDALANLIYEDYQLYTAMSVLKGTMLTSGQGKEVPAL